VRWGVLQGDDPGSVMVDPGRFESRRLTAVPVAAVLANEAAVAILRAHGAAMQAVPYHRDPDHAPAELPACTRAWWRSGPRTRGTSGAGSG
jgi:hypothetical protein